MWIFNTIMILTVVATGFIVGITPLISRQATPFGISLPSQYVKDPTVHKYVKQYAIWIISISALLILPMLGLPLFFTFDQQLELILSIYVTVAITLQLILSFVLYLKYRKALQQWKQSLPTEAFNQHNRIIIDTHYHDKLTAIPFTTFFLAQFVIWLVTILLAVLNYDRIHELIPLNWNLNFEVSRTVEKSWKVVLALPGIQLLLIPIMQFGYYSFIKSRQKLSPVAPLISSEKSRLFREAWARFIFILAVLTQLLLSSLYLYSLFIQESHFGWLMTLTIIYLLYSLGGSIYLSLRYGQAGEKLSLPGDSDEDLAVYQDAEEDAKWIAGLFYYNPDDAAIFVEKRFGIGSTLNMARWQAWVTVLGLIAFLVITIIWSIMLG